MGVTAIATDIERLIVVLEAATKNYERGLAKAQGTTVSALRRIERDLQVSATRQQAIFTRMGTGLQSTLRRSLIGGFATLGATLSGRSLIRFADSFTRIENAMKVVGLEGKELQATLDAVFKIALKHGAPIEALVELYRRLALVQKEMGISSRDLDSFLDNVAASLRVSGVSAEQARGALLQLSQMLDGTAIRAQEFNSILDGAPAIIQAAARGLEEAGGSVAKLRQMMLDGAVSSQAFFAAFQVGSVETQRLAQQTNFTIGQAMENVRTAFTLAVGTFDDATGASEGFSDALKALAQELSSSRVLGAIADLAELINDVGDAYDSVTASARAFLAQLGLSGPTLAEFVKQANTVSNFAAKGNRLPVSADAPKPVSLADFPVTGKAGTGTSGGDTAKQLNEFERANEAIKRRIDLLGLEADVFGKSTAEAEKARIAFELLEAAKAANIPITAELRSQIDALATAYGDAAGKITALEEAERSAAQAAEELARAQEASIQRMEDLRDAGTDSMKGFVKDLIDGKSAADALNNAMQRLADRLIDMGLDSIFGSIFGGGPGSQFGNFGLFGSFKPNTGVGGTIGSPAYVWVVNSGVAGAAGGGGGLFSGLSGLFGGTSTPALAAASPASFTTQSHTPIPVEVKELPTISSTSGLLLGGGGTTTLTGGNFFDDMVKSVQSFPDFSASTPTNSSTFFKNSAKGMMSADSVPTSQFPGFSVDTSGLLSGGGGTDSFTTSIQASADRITSGADTLADSVGTAATAGEQFASGVTDVGSTAQSSAGQFSSQFPQAMQQVIQSITSTGGAFGSTFGSFGTSFFGTFGGFGGAPGFTPGVVLSRQHGGPVGANQPYIVGERGQELFVPKSSGYIVPDFEGFMKAMTRIDHSRSGSGRPINQTNNFITPTIADRRSQNQMARRAVDDLTRSQRTS